MEGDLNKEYLRFYWIIRIINVQFSLINVHNSSPDFYSTSICLTIEQVTCRMSRSCMCYSIKTSMKHHLFSFSLAYVQHFSHNTQHADLVG